MTYQFGDEVGYFRHRFTLKIQMSKNLFEFQSFDIRICFACLREALRRRQGFRDSNFEFMEPHGQSPWSLGQRHVGRHSGHTMAHSSTAKGRDLMLPE
jgi:hypothetical protein